MRVGQRVYWHGVSPNPKRVGTVKLTGTMRHEVQWDDSEGTSLESIAFLMPFSKFGKCCPYCASLKERQAQN